MAEQEQKSTFADTADKEGKPLHIFSSDGIPKTAVEFNTAMDEYDKSGKAPQGYTVLEPGVLADINTAFQRGMQPIQRGLRAIGKGAAGGLGVPGGLAIQLGEKTGILPTGSTEGYKQTTENIGSKVGEIVGAPVRTLPGYLTALGTAAATPFLNPVTKEAANVAGQASKYVADKTAMLGNMVKSGIGGTIGYLTGTAAAGEPINLGKTMTEFGIIAAGQGIAGVLNHAITKYISPNRQEQVAKGILDEVTSTNPVLKNDPSKFEIYAGNSQANLSALAQKVVSGMRGTVDDVTETMMTELRAQGPRFNKGQLNTLRAQVRNIVKASNDVLDNIGIDDKAYNAALKTVNESVGSMIDYIGSIDPQYIMAQTRVTHLLSKYSQDLMKMQEGAEVINALKKSGMGSGWNAMKFGQHARGEYQAGNETYKRVGDILGGGRPLTQLPQAAQETSQAAPTVMSMLTDAYKTFTGSKLPVLQNAFGLGGRPAPQQVPWGDPAPALTPLQNITVQEAAQESQRAAMKTFIGKGQ